MSNPLGSCVACGSAPCSCPAGACSQSSCGCCGQPFTVLTGGEISSTLTASLTACVDQIRDIYTQLGTRTYTVSLVWTQWSGGERGVGVEEVIRDEALLPTPLISDMSAVGRQVLSIGTEEVGQIRVSEISPRFSEDYLVGNENDGTPVQTDQNFYWEVFFRRANGTGVRRRFIPKGVPNYAPTKFQWEIDLLKAYENRTRQGDPTG